MSSSSPPAGRLVKASSPAAQTALRVGDGCTSPASSPAEELAAVTAEQVLGMTRDQLRLFEDRATAEPATFAALSPEVKRAVVRKNFYLALLEELQKQAEQLAKW